MVYGFVRQSGGQVRIYSEVGQGTTCASTCRATTARRTRTASTRAQPTRRAPSAGETVLVVDDEPTVRMLVTEVLEDLGYARHRGRRRRRRA